MTSMMCASVVDGPLSAPAMNTDDGEDPLTQSLVNDGANRTYQPAEVLDLQEVLSLGYTYSAYNAEWSSDGEYLVVTLSYHPGSHELYLYSFNGTALSLVTTLNFDTNVIEVDWSPNGSYLAFGSDKTEYGVRVYSFNGVTLNLVTSTSIRYVSDVDWSPDGRYLAVTGVRSSNENLAVYSFNGTALTHLDSLDLGNFGDETDWSPDGTRLAVAGDDSIMDPDTWEFTYYGKAFIISFNGTTLVEELAIDMVEGAYCVDWNVDGDHVAIGWKVTYNDQRLGVFRVHEDQHGSVLMTLVDNINYGGSVSALAWSPNGGYILFTGGKDGEQVGLASFDGTDLTWEDSWALPGAYSWGIDLSWSQDGMHVAVCCWASSIRLFVYSVDYGPLSSNDRVVLDEDQTSILDVLANDWTISGTLEITNHTLPASGTVQVTPDGKDLLFTPAANWSGEVGFTYRHSDMVEASPSVEVNITVLPVNDVPVITTLDVVEATEDEPYSVQYYATDADMDDVLTWSADPGADWLDFNGTTALLSGLPTNDDVGSFFVTITVTDANASVASTSFQLTVHNVNDGPTITTEDVSQVDEDQLYSVYYKAEDVDPTHDVMTWSAVTGADWLVMHENHLTGTPTNDDVGEHVVNVTVTDGNGGIDWTEFTINVVNTNDGPQITTEPTTTALEDEEYNVTLEAEDVDVGDMLEWAMTGPAWLSIDGDTGVLAGTPSNDDVGINLVTVTVSDGNLEDRIDLAITVANTNDAPVWVEPPTDQELMEGDMMFLDVMAEDEDGDALTYGLSTDPSSSMAMTRTSGAIRWLTAVVGTFECQVTATDGTETITHEFTVTVNAWPEPPVNNVPVIGDVGQLNVTEGEAFWLMLVGSDGDEWDAGNLTWTLVDGPEGMVISSEGDVLWLPDDDTVGVHQVTVELTDGKDKATLDFEVEVLEVEDDGGDTSDVEGGDYLWLVIALALVVVLLVAILLRTQMGQQGTATPGSTEEDGEPEVEE
jgi:Tol biopolymer transport system component